MFSSDKWLSSPASGFYPHSISQSLRFEDGDSAHLSRNPDANSSNGRNLNTTSFWVKRGNLGSTQMMYAVGSSFPSNHNDSSVIQFLSDDTLRYRTESAGSATSQLDTTRVFRDVSSWYHIHLIFDRDNSTETDRLKLYINGVRETVFDSADYPTTSENSQFTNNKLTYIGRSTGNYFDGYIAEFVSIDSAAVSHDSFGELKDGIWIPKDISSGLTYGDNGFHLTFEATGTATTAQDTTAQTNIGDDQSGLGNNFAVSALVASDVVPDSPTNNFATMNPLHKASSSVTLSEGNLKAAMNSTSGSGYTIAPATMSLPLSGKWYWEGDFSGANTGGSLTCFAGVFDSTIPVVGKTANFINTAGDYIIWYSHKNSIRNSSLGNTNNFQSHIDTQASGTVSFAIDMDNRWVWVAVNGVYINGTPDFSDGTNRVFLLTEGVTYIPFFAHNGGSGGGWEVNFGQDSANVSSANTDSNGIGTFEYAVPSGYTSLCTANLPEPAIISGEDYFNTVLYTGNSGTQSITGVGFQPDWVWGKNRGNTYNHVMYDSVRGVEKRLEITGTSTETTKANGLTAFGTDGFTVGGDGALNENAKGIVSWNWKAGTAVSGNTTGSGTAKTYAGSVNTDAGFSIIKYTGNGTAGHTIPHNLTVGGVATAPTMVIAKNLDQGDDWAVYHNAIGAGNYLKLNESNGSASAAQVWNDTTPSDSVFSVGSNHQTNATDEDYIAYCFADIDGYCKAGSYTGNGNADGTYVSLNFRPAWVMIKEAGASGFWMITDNKVYPNTNGNTRSLAANDAGSETTISNRGNEVDFLSNGFKIRASTGDMGASNTHIFLAFAEQPFKYSNAR